MILRIRVKLFLITMLFSILSCSFKSKLIVSPNGRSHLTLFENTDNLGKSYTIIAYGKLKTSKNLELKSHVKVQNSYSDAWYCLVTWEGSKAIIFQPYSNFSGKNLNVNFELRKMKDTEFSKIFFSDIDDKYLRISSINKNDFM